MGKFVSWIIIKIKHREYIVDEDITSLDLVAIIIGRVIMLIRGIGHRGLFKQCSGLVFIGKEVNDYAVSGGIPAKVLKFRKTDLIDL